MKLIDIINNTSVVVAYQGDETFDEIVEKAIEVTKRSIIANIEEVAPTVNGWIPCSERLPEDSLPVLITHRGGVSYGWYNGRYFERGAKTNHKKLQTVIAWMPLPEPYREEGEAE